MVDYIKLMPVDIQEMIFSIYFKRHVLKEMVERYFPHLRNLKSDKEFNLFKQHCIRKHTEACENDNNFNIKFLNTVHYLSNEFNTCYQNEMYINVMKLINFFSEEPNLGLIYRQKCIYNSVYNKLNDPKNKYLCSINPSYFILLFNEVPLNTHFRGCY